MSDQRGDREDGGLGAAGADARAPVDGALRRLAAGRRRGAPAAELSPEDLAALARLLGTLLPPHDRAGEEAAVAAFRAARAEDQVAAGAPGTGRRWSWRALTARAGRRGRLAALGVALATLLGGGVAVAGSGPFLPRWGGGAVDRSPDTGMSTPPGDERDARRLDPSPSPPNPGADQRRPGAGSRTGGSSPSVARLCHAYQRLPAERRPEALRRKRFAALVAAAGGVGGVDAYCEASRVTNGPGRSGDAGRRGGGERPGATGTPGDRGRSGDQGRPESPGRPSDVGTPGPAGGASGRGADQRGGAAGRGEGPGTARRGAPEDDTGPRHTATADAPPAGRGAGHGTTAPATVSPARTAPR